MEMLYMIEPWHWLVLGFLLMIAEILIPTFASLWFGAAAVIVAALAWLLPIGILTQVLIWLGLSVVFMLAWFKFIKPLSKRGTLSIDKDMLIGETGMIISAPDVNKRGRLRFSVPIMGDDEWVCRTKKSGSIDVGTRVTVMEVSGDALIVAPTQNVTRKQKSAAPRLTSDDYIYPDSSHSESIRPDITPRATEAQKSHTASSHKHTNSDKLSLKK